jgi:hypothetical protein
VQDRGPDLAFYVVADDGKAGVLEAAAPLRIRCDEDGDTVDEAAACLDGAPRVPFAGLLRTDRQIGDDDVGPRFQQHVGDIGFRA